jgi:aspartyl-tRNA(Asn)/glutamyl-tRNA(Gln) amidotransferase subunit C
MKVDHNTVDKIAHLARLEVYEHEQEELIGDMNKILSFMEKLNELDTTGIEPLVYMSEAVNVMRDDIVKAETSHEDALLNAPSRDDNYFRVSKVIPQ